MKFFYGRLREEPDPSLALREAVLALRETNPHPYYWAPFVWMGKVAVYRSDNHKLNNFTRAT